MSNTTTLVYATPPHQHVQLHHLNMCNTTTLTSAHCCVWRCNINSRRRSGFVHFIELHNLHPLSGTTSSNNCQTWALITSWRITHLSCQEQCIQTNFPLQQWQDYSKFQVIIYINCNCFLMLRSKSLNRKRVHNKKSDAVLSAYISWISLRGAFVFLPDLLICFSIILLPLTCVSDTGEVAISTLVGELVFSVKLCLLFLLCVAPSCVSASYDLGATYCSNLVSRLWCFPSCILPCH